MSVTNSGLNSEPLRFGIWCVGNLSYFFKTITIKKKQTNLTGRSKITFNTNTLDWWRCAHIKLSDQAKFKPLRTHRSYVLWPTVDTQENSLKIGIKTTTTARPMSKFYMAIIMLCHRLFVSQSAQHRRWGGSAGYSQGKVIFCVFPQSNHKYRVELVKTVKMIKRFKRKNAFCFVLPSTTHENKHRIYFSHFV